MKHSIYLVFIWHLIGEEDSCHVRESSSPVECQMKTRQEVMKITVGSEEIQLSSKVCKCFSRNPFFCLRRWRKKNRLKSQTPPPKAPWCMPEHPTGVFPPPGWRRKMGNLHTLNLCLTPIIELRHRPRCRG